MTLLKRGIRIDRRYNFARALFDGSSGGSAVLCLPSDATLLLRLLMSLSSKQSKPNSEIERNGRRMPRTKIYSMENRFEPLVIINLNEFGPFGRKTEL